MSRAGRLRVVVCAVGVVLVGALSLAPVGAMAAPSAGSGVPTRSDEWWLTAMNVEKAWSLTKGEGVTVAVIDTGVDLQHPDLVGAIAGGTGVNGATPSDGGPVQTQYTEPDPHGTGVAVDAVGRGHGAGGLEGITGTAPGARLLSIGVPGEVGAADPNANADAEGTRCNQSGE